MAKKRTLLVGVSSGLGLMAAKQLLKEHDHIVYACAPDIEPMQALEDAGATLLEMDVTSTESVERAVNAMVEAEGGIDVVFFNSGLHVSAPIEGTSEEIVERTYNVNVFGAGRVIRACGPVFRKQRSGRMVFTSSIVSHGSLMMSGWYASTKHALKGMLTAFRQEVKDFGIEVVMIEPGQINTGFEQATIEKLRANEHIDDYQPIVNQYCNFTAQQMHKVPTGERTADFMVKAITTDKPKLFYRTSLDAVVMPFLLKILPTKLYDNILIKTFAKHG